MWVDAGASACNPDGLWGWRKFCGARTHTDARANGYGDANG